MTYSLLSPNFLLRIFNDSQREKDYNTRDLYLAK